MKSIKHYIIKAIYNPEKIFRKIDKIFFGGHFRGMADSCKEKKQRKLALYITDHPEEYYDAQVKQMLRKNSEIGQSDFSVKDILLAQFQDGEGVFYDIAVRLLAIEQYYGKNNFGYDMYARMQSGAYGYGAFWLDRFVNLIQKYENDGLASEHPIEVDDNLLIMDGAGRLALAIYHNIEFVPVKIRKTFSRRKWNYNILWELNFTSDEIKLIQEKAIELYNKSNYRCVGVIWPSAYHLREEIVEDVNSYLTSGLYNPMQNVQIKVSSYTDYSFDKLDFIGFLRSMYAADGMTDVGIEWKFKIISDCLQNKEKYPIRVFYLDVSNLEITKNETYITARSQVMAKVKRVIRNRYRDKVKHYEYDNVMHISDNYQQSVFCEKAVSLKKDVTGLFEELNQQFEYAIIKLDGRQSEDFPKSFFYHTDVDLLAEKDDVKGLGDYIEKWLKKAYESQTDNWIKTERIADEDEQIMIRIALRGWSCFMIHIQTVSHFDMNEEFGKECLVNRVLAEDKPIYALPPKYDMLFRAVELLHNPKKVWHREYVAKYINEYDESLMDVACGQQPELLQGMKELFSKLANEKR